MSEPVLRLTNVKKTYTLGRINRRKVEAIRGVSLEVRPGDIYGFLGPNGAGKTTTVRCILGLSQPESGHIERFGKAYLEPTHFFSRTAYCPEESHFPAYLTGRELLFHWSGMFGLEKGKIASRVDEALETVGLTDAATRRVGTYSKGMKQRVGIAGCLLSDPDLVILDEPARGLDPLARHLVRKILLDLADKGKTLFMNSHILSEVERVCTRAAIINNGVISKEFTMSELEGSGGIDVVYKPGPGDLPAPDGVESRSDGSLRYVVADTAELARFAQQVADNGGEVLKASKQRIDLEDYFIRVVEESKS